MMLYCYCATLRPANACNPILGAIIEFEFVIVSMRCDTLYWVYSTLPKLMFKP